MWYLIASFGGLLLGGFPALIFGLKAYSSARELGRALERAAQLEGRSDAFELKLGASMTSNAELSKALKDAKLRCERLEDLYAKSHLSTVAGPDSRADFVQALQELSATLATDSGRATVPVRESETTGTGPNGLIDPFL